MSEKIISKILSAEGRENFDNIFRKNVDKPVKRGKLQILPFTSTIVAKEGDTIKVWMSDQRCPDCNKLGRERAGADFQNMNRCSDCGHVWTPSSWYLLVRSK